MGSGRYGGFGNTKGSFVPGDASFMGDSEVFLQYIKRRKDVDPGGKFDLIAHGTTNSMEIQHGSKKVRINSRTAAKLIKQMPDYHKGQPIRLLSCNTGASSASFAQNLANKLNVSVWAPSNYLWVNPNGTHFIAGKNENGFPDYSNKGKFIEYKPGGNKK